MHAIRELSDSYQMSKLALDSMVDYAVLIMDKKGIILSSNCGAKNLIGFQSSEVEGTHFARFYTMEDIARMHPEYELKQTEVMGRFEEEGLRVRKDGSKFWAHIILNRLNDQSGNLIGYSKVFRDLTVQKRHEQEMKKVAISARKNSKLKTQFIADISHEIRTPLGAILGFAEFLRKEDVSQEARNHYLDIILKNGKCLNRVINEVLDLSKIEAGRTEIELNEFILNDLIEEVVELFMGQCLTKNITLNYIKNPEIQNVTSDPNRLKQVLNNLLSNAIKFTQNGSITITVTKLDENQEAVIYRINIADTGEGLSTDEVTKLFQPFSQTGKSHKSIIGTGLGLVLSRKIAVALGGDVELLSSAPATGSVFGMSFTDYRGLRTFAEPQVKEVVLRSLEHKSILVVDDSEDNLEIIKIFLNSYGGEVDLAASGPEALLKLQNRNYDVVLMDIEMPGMDGFKVIKEIKKMHYQVPVIALTAHAMNEDRLRTKNAGFCEHVTKPIDFCSLINLINKI